MIPFKDDNPRNSFPIITILLIVINVVVYFYQLSLKEMEGFFVLHYGAIPNELFKINNLSISNYLYPYSTLISAMFIHGGILHLAGNMLYLWIFGDNVEDYLGKIKFLLFYLISGIIGTLTHAVFNIHSDAPLIGASGAIAGVLGAYIILFPKANVYILFFFFFFIRVIKLPALIVLGFWFLIQILNSAPSAGANMSSVAWFAHIGGFIAGIFLLFLLREKSSRLKR